MIHVRSNEKETPGNRTFSNNEIEILTRIIPPALIKLEYSDFSIQYANDSFYALHGYTRKEYSSLFGADAAACIHPEDVQAIKPTLSKQLSIDNYFQHEYRITKKDGSLAWLQLKGSISLEGTHLSYHCSCTDISDAKDELERLRTSYEKQLQYEARKQLLLSQLSDEIEWEYDIKTASMYHSDKLDSAFSNLPVIPDFRESILSSGILHDLDLAYFSQFCDELDAGQAKIQCELRFKNSADEYSWYSIKGRSLYDQENIPVKVVGKALCMEQDKINTSLLQSMQTLNSSDISLDSNFIITTMDHLADSTNIHSSLRDTLSGLCLYFNIDYACIVQYSSQSQHSMVTHDWCTTNPPILPDHFTLRGKSAFNRHGELFQKNRLFISQDLSLQKAESGITKGMYESNIKAVMQYALYEHDEFCGFIGIQDSSQSRIWNPNEINTFLILAKSISTYLHQNEKQVNSPSYYDNITGLISFAQFLESGHEQISNNERNFALISLDIDNFKFYNETYGFCTGNQILIYLSKVLQQHLTSDELCARSSGDHFVLLITYKDRSDLNHRLNKLKNYFETKGNPSEEYYNINLSYGVYLLSQDEKELTTLIDKANLSRESVKTLAGTHYQIYTNELLEKLEKTQAFEKEIEQCLAYGELIPYYQPKFSMQDNKVIGAEVFARLITPDNKILYPKDFIPIFEKNGLISYMDFYIFETVCRTIKNWIEQSMPLVPVSINIAEIHLKKPEFISHLTELISKYNVPPEYIELEFSERIFMNNASSIHSLLHQLKDIGFKISMDNSNLEFFSIGDLSELALDKINVSKHIYANFLTQKRKTLVSKMIEAAKSLDIEISFTGAETSYQYDISKELGFDSSQGFLYTHPMPVDEFEEYVVLNAR